jgi:adenine-specific DNA-methyltransferase
MPRKAGNYTHPTASALIRPDAGTQPQFRKKKKPATYRYDSSLAPDLNWDGKNPVREQGEHLIRQILDAKHLAEAKATAEKLAALGRPFLN